MPGDDERLIADGYTRLARAYETRVVPRFAPIARRTLDLAGIGPGSRVLDVGCGTGLATLLAAEAAGPGGEVVGVDYSRGQLRVAEEKRARLGLGQARFEEGDATRLAFDGRFDAAVSNLGLPADFAPCLLGMARALRPGGRVSVAEWSNEPREPFASVLAAIAARAAAAGDDLARLRVVAAARRGQFARLGTERGMVQALEAAGLQEAQARTERYEASFASWREAYHFVTSWGVADTEARNVPEAHRPALEEDLRRRLGDAPFRVGWSLVHATGGAAG